MPFSLDTKLFFRCLLPAVAGPVIAQARGENLWWFPLTCPRLKTLLPGVRFQRNQGLLFETLKLWQKFMRFGVPTWSKFWLTSGKVASETPLGRGSGTEWRKFMERNVGFLGWPTSLKHSKYKPKLGFSSFALAPLMAQLSINFEAIWLASWIQKWSRASQRCL